MGLGQGLLASFIEYVEQFILAVLFLVFLFHIRYGLYKEILRKVKSSPLVFS